MVLQSQFNMNNLKDQNSQENSNTEKTTIISDNRDEIEKLLTSDKTIPNQSLSQLVENEFSNITPLIIDTNFNQIINDDNLSYIHSNQNNNLQYKDNIISNNDLYYSNIYNDYQPSIHSNFQNFNQNSNEYYNNGIYNNRQNNISNNQPYYNTIDQNMYASNYNYDYINYTPKSFTSPQNIRSQQNNINRYSNGNILTNTSLPVNTISITKEMINVVNTTTMSKFANEQVCQQINSILENQPKNHQTIILAEREVNYNEKNIKKLDDDSVLNLLKETGFNLNSNSLIDDNKYLDNIRQKSIQSNIQNDINMNVSNTTNSITDDNISNNVNLNSSRLSSSPRINRQNIDSNTQNLTRTENANSSILDLSISSDEDGKTSKYGPIGSNPKLNNNQNSSIRRMSQTVNDNGQLYENLPQNLNYLTYEITNNNIVPRTRSLGSKPDNMNLIFEDNKTQVFYKLNNTDSNNVISQNINPYINNMILDESLLTRMSSSLKKTQIPTTCIMNSLENSFKNCYLDNRGLSNTRIYNYNRNIIQQEIISKDIYSRKVFVGGLPQDITESQISLEFKKFGELTVDWPHKLDSNSGLPPKGYAFLLFTDSESVMSLIRSCQSIDDKFYWTVSSQRSDSKQVQIRPWTLTDNIWSLKNPIMKPVPRCKQTVFVGGIPRQAQAKELFDNMNRCFGGVDLVEIDVDIEFSYPKGAASVTFGNLSCYMKALETHFITLKLCGMEKRVEIKPFFSDDQHCEDCGILMNSRVTSNSNNSSSQTFGQSFCVARGCLKYFCDNCWIQHQVQFGHNESHHSSKPGTGVHRQFIFKRGVFLSHHANSNRQNIN